MKSSITKGNALQRATWWWLPLLVSLLGCEAPAPDLGEAVALGSATSPLTCSFNREFDFTSNWDFAQLSSSAVQEATVEANGRLHTIAPIWVGNYPNQQFDTLLTITDCNGSVSARRLGTPNTDEHGHAMVISHDGLHGIITGRAEDDVWVAKINLNTFNVVWSHRIGQPGFVEFGETVVPLSADVVGATDYLVGGQAYVNAGGAGRLHMLRIADNGTLRWSRYYERAMDNQEHAGINLRNEMALVSTTSQDPATQQRVFSIFEVRLTTGESVTVHYYPSPNNPAWNNRAVQVPRLLALPSGGFIASYSTRSADLITRAALLRLDDNLDALWEKSYTGPGDIVSLSVSTYGSRFALSNAADGASAMMFTTSTGNVLENRRYQAPVGAHYVTPATRLGSQWLLRTVANSTMTLTTVAAPSQGCSKNVATTAVNVTRDHVIYTPISPVWGVIGNHPVNVSFEGPIYRNEICR